MSNFKTATRLKLRFRTEQGTLSERRQNEERESKFLDELIKMRDGLAKKK